MNERTKQAAPAQDPQSFEEAVQSRVLFRPLLELEHDTGERHGLVVVDLFALVRGISVDLMPAPKRFGDYFVSTVKADVLRTHYDLARAAAHKRVAIFDTWRGVEGVAFDVAQVRA